MSSLILVVAAGSGGHILPALTFAQGWCAQKAGRAISFVGGHKKLDATIVHHAPEISFLTRYYLINIPGIKVWRYPLFLVQMVRVSLQSLSLLKKQKPELVYTTGGLLAFPVCLAARILCIPIMLHELNAVPGKAMRWLAPFASKILLTFDSSKTFFKKHESKCELVPYPVRFTKQDTIYTKSDIIAQVNRFVGHNLFDEHKITILILGGSQGSLFLNNLLTSWVGALSQEEKQKLQIIHQAGIAYEQELIMFYKEQQVAAFVFGYHHQVDVFYKAADLIICRAGAGTLFEVLFFNKKSLVIPLEQQADDHQLANALQMAAGHPELFTVMRQDEIVQERQKALELITRAFFVGI